MAAHTHLVHPGHVGYAWKLRLAEIGVVILAGLGLYYAVSDWRRGEIVEGLMAFGPLAGAAIIYAFGYLWCLPDVLGGTAHDQTRTLQQRWSDFALLSVFIALLIIVAAYVRAIWVNFSYVNLVRALAILLACCWLLAASVVASERYLGWTMPRGEGRGSMGWRARVRHGTWACGNFLLWLLGVKRALVIGGALALLSLTIAVGDDWLGDNSGYNIVTGKVAWPMAAHLNVTKLAPLLVQAHRGIYVLGLVVAALALVGVVPGRLGRSIRSSRILATLAGAIALLQVTHAAVAAEADKYPLAIAILIWAVPIAIWLRGGRGGRENSDHTRVAVMVFYFPIFLVGLAFLVFFTYMSAGFGGFVIGMLLVWWGLVQSPWCKAEIQLIRRT
jgi:hypothetical protein